jgi:hypothetical protein
LIFEREEPCIAEPAQFSRKVKDSSRPEEVAKGRRASKAEGNSDGKDQDRVTQFRRNALVWRLPFSFARGFLSLGFLKGIFAILLWPYYIGVALRPLLPLVE